MPCNSDHCRQSGTELESKRVCENIIYLYGKISKKVPKWIEKTVSNYHGNVSRLDEATKDLCYCCRGLTPNETKEYIYNARNERSRKLASWWERHQEWDKRRVKEEEKERAKDAVCQKAMQKLTVAEVKALGLSLG